MSLKFNPNKQLVESTELNLNGKSFVTLSSGEGTENREIVRVIRKNGTSRVGLNRTGEKVAKVTVTNQGVGYLITPTITVSQPDIISPNSKVAVLSAVRDPDTGSIISVIITDAGRGYSQPPTLTFSEAPQGGVTAQATCELDTIDYELDVLGAIRTSASIVSDSATVTNLNVLNFVTPGVLLRAPRLGSYTNLTNPNLPFFGQTIYPELTSTPPLQDQSNRIATTKFVYDVATNDVGGRIYVSSEIGNDTNNGRSPAKPVKTIKKAAQLAAATVGRETLIVAGGEYYEDNPISIPPLCSVIGDNLRLVIVRPLNPGRHMFKASNQNYMNGLTFRDALDSEGNPVYTHNFAFVFDDKQRFYFDDEIGGDPTRLDSSESFKRKFPIGHKMFGQKSAILNIKEHTGTITTLQNLVAAGTLIVGQDTSCEATLTSVISATPLPDAEWSAEQEYALEDIIRVSNSIYKVTTAGTSGTVAFSGVLATPKQATNGTAAYIYLGDRREASLNIVVTEDSPSASFADDEIISYTVNGNTYQANVALFTSTRAEGEVVKYGETEVRNYIVEEIDATTWGDYPTPGDDGTLTAGSGGVVFKFDGLHELKEFDIVFIKKPANAPAALNSFFGYQRVDEVLYDADGFSRRIVVKKQIAPQYTSVYLPPAGQCTCRAKTKYVEITLLNSPYGFTDSVFTSYRFLDAVTFIRNNRDFIAEEITGAITSRYPDFIYPGTLTTRYRFKDARNLIYKNLDLLADEATGWLWNESNFAVWGQANLGLKDKCRRDVKYFLRGLANDLYDGSNKSTITVTKSYFSAVTGAPISNGLVGVEGQSIAAFNKAAELAKLAVTNSLPLTPSYSTLTPFRDLSLTHDPTTNLNVGENNCTNVRNAITTLTAILTTAIDDGNLNALPEVSSVDGAADGENFCKRDIKHILNAVIADLPYGGNATSIEAAKSYRNNSTSSIEYIDNQHRQSRFAFRLARDYAILAMRNWQTKINMTFTEDSDIVEIASPTGTIGLVPKMRLYYYNLSNQQVETDYFIKEVVSPTQVRIWKYNTGLDGSDHTFAAGEDTGIKTRAINLKLLEGETSFTTLWTDNLVPRTTDYPEFPECADVASTLINLFSLINDIVVNNTDDRYFDATDLIEFNKDFIAEEVSGWLKETYDGFAYPLPTFTKVVIQTSNADAFPAFIKVTNLSGIKVGQLVTSGDAIQDNTYISSIDEENKILYLTKSLETGMDAVTIHPDVYLDESMRYKDASNLILKNKDYIADRALAEVAVEYPDFNFPGNAVTDEFSRFADGYRLIQQNKKEIIDFASAEIAVQHPDFYFPADQQTTSSSRYKDSYRLIQQNKDEIVDRALAQVAINYPDFYFPGDSQTTAQSRFFDSYRLIQQNKQEIIDTAWTATVAQYPGISTTQNKCKRDLGYFVDAISLDIFLGGNKYSRQFVLQYFNSGAPISNGLLGEEVESNYAFNQAKDLMKSAITNQLTVKDLTLTADPATNSNTNANSCANVRSALDSLTLIVTDRITAGNLTGLPSETASTIEDGKIKCRRDLKFLVDYLALDLFVGGNSYTRKFVLSYFNGNTFIANGLAGETAQSIVAFNAARDMMKKAITNQLYVKDLTLSAGPAIFGGSGGNISVDQSGNAASCVDVQNSIDSLMSIVTDVISSLDLNDLPVENDGHNNRYEDAADLIYNNRQEIIDRAAAQIGVDYPDFYYPGDPQTTTSSRFKDSYRLIQQNKQEIIDRAAAEIAVQFPDFYYPNDSQTTSTSRFKDSYRLIQLNRNEIISNAYAAIAVFNPSFVNPNPQKCQRDIGYFVDALSLDISNGGGNKYTRQFILQYFNNGSPISNGLVGEEAESIVAFNKARDEMKRAVTNQLTVKDLTVTADPATNSNTNANSCANVRSAIDSLALIVSDRITAGNLTGLPSETTGTIPAGEAKCKRDIGYFIDAVSLDLTIKSNKYSRKFIQQYFINATTPISNGLVGETAQSVVAFNMARDMMKKAITNQLYVKDLTLTDDPLTNDNTDPTSCANVRTTIDTLTSLITARVTAGNLTGLPEETSTIIPAGEAKCKRDIGHFINAIEADLRQLTDYNTRSFLTYYFTPDGTSWISDTLQGEQTQSIVAFNKARDVIKQAITNQLYFKDLTITADPLTTSNVDPASCADVQSLVTNLTTLVTDTITDGSLGTTRSGFLAAASYDVLVGEIKCKRDIGYFVDAVSLDVFTKGNKYSREFTTQYFTNVSSPLTNGLFGETAESITAFNKARDMMSKAVTNQLFVKDLTLSEGPAVYNGGGGDIPLLPSGNAASCQDVQASITSLTEIITDVISSGSLISLDTFTESQGAFGIGESKCRRDIGYVIDAVAKDIADGGNWRTVNAARYYFQEGDPISNGLVGEEAASIIAFNKARDLMVDAMRNQLNYHDLSITTDPLRLSNLDKLTCVNVESSINTLVSIITTIIDDGNLNSLSGVTVARGAYSLNEIKCKRDIKFMIDAVINDITLNDSNKNSIQYANFYKQQNGNIKLIDSQLIQSVAAFRKTRDLCILAMRNWLEFPQKQYYQKKYTDLNYVRDEFVIEDDQIPYCANVATAITNRFDTIINILTGDSDNENLDTANQIAINENFIINEALAAGEQQYPAVSIPNITKCKRDLRFILRAVQRDVILGGTVGITRAADSYLTGATLDVGFVGDQLGKTLFIYEYAKHMAIAATRNWHFEIRNCTTTSNSAVVSVPNTNGIVIGMRVSANQFRYTDYTPDTYTYVIDIDRENNTVTLDQVANTSTSTAKLFFTFSEVGAPWFDAANSINSNKTFIAQEAVGYIEDIYPYLTTLNASTSYADIVSDYDNATCQRDIGYVLDAFIHDLRYGGNAETIRAAEYYRNASGHLDYVGNQLIQSLETFEKVKDLAILSIRNWKTGASTTYTKQFATANYVVNNNLLADPSGYPECAFVEASIESLFNQFIDVLTNNSGGTKIDAARLIARNFTYIAEESLGAADNEYPLVTVPDEAKCLRDIQLIMTAWIKDIITGGNSGSVQATQAYLTNTGAVTFIQDELEKSRYAFAYAKDLVKQAITNNLPAGTYTLVTPYTDLTILADPATGDNTDPASCESIQDTVDTLWGILDDTLAQSGAPLPAATYGTQYNPRKYFPINFPGFFAGGYFSGLQRASTDEFITEDTSYPECASIVTNIINLFAILDSVLNGNALPEVTNDNVALVTLNTGTLYNPTIVQGSGTMIDAGNRPVIRGRMINANDIIEVSPYIQNCSIISFLGGGGCEVDGSKIKQVNVPRPGLREDGKSILAPQGKSMVANAFTIISQGGTGYLVNNDGYCQLVSVFCIFCQDGILAESGGYASVTNSASNFGTYALRAVGYRKDPYVFDIGTIGEIGTTSAGKTVFRVNGLGRKPVENFVMKIDGYENVVSDIEYFVTVVSQTTVGGTGEVSSRIEFNDALLLRNKQSGTLVNLNTSELIGKTIRLFRPSIINSSGHSFEYIGSGIDYYGLPENGGQKIEDNEQVSQRYGRVYASGTDEAGDFKVGRTVKMENRTGNIFFTGQVSISEIEFLRIRGGDLVVTGFDASPTLGGAAATNQKLPTQKAVRDFVTNNVGPYFGKPYSTNPVPNALVELGNDGKINLDQIPPIRPFKVYTVNNSSERLALEGLNSGDIAVQVTRVNDTINDADVDVANNRIYTPKTGFSSGQIVTIISSPASPIVTNAGPIETGDLYYLIVDLPYIQLASSPENVIDNVPLTITSAGSGDTSIQIATGTVSYILNNDVDTQFLAYTPDLDVTFNNGALVIGSSTGAIASVTSTTYGTVYSISVSTGGNVYLNETPTVVISAPDQPGGVQATANAVVVGSQISSITITEKGSGYDTPPTVSVSLGEIAWSAGQSYSVDDLIYVDTNLYIITTEGTSGTSAFTGQTSTPQAADGGTCFYAYVGERAELVSFVESRVYVNIENAIKFIDTDNINSHDVPAVTVNLNRVVNTSASNEFNWVPLTSASIDAASIATGTISTSRLALPNTGSANSFTFLRGDQSFKPVVQGVKLPESKFLAKTILSSDAGLSYITLPLTSLVLSGQRVEGNGIPADTIVLDTLTISGNTRVSLSSLLVDDVPKGQVITFRRTETPLQFDSNFTKGAYAAEIFVESPGNYYTSTITSGTVGQNTINVVDVTGAEIDQPVFADGVGTNAVITNIQVVSGTSGIITLSVNNTADITNKSVTFGVGYTTGTYNNVELFGSNTGTGAKASFTVQAGLITSAKITDGGTGYTADFDIDPIPGVLGLGTGAKLTVLASTQQTYFSGIEVDVKRVTNQTTSLDAFGTVGVARFQKSQYTFGPNGAVTLKTGPESGLDSDLLDGKQGTFYLDASNLESGTLRTDRLSGTYSIDITGKSATTTRVETITDSINAVPAPSAYASGLSLALRISENYRSSLTDRTLENDGSRVTLMTLRPSGIGTDAGGGGLKQIAFTDGTVNIGTGGGGASSATTIDDVVPNMYIRGTGNIIPTDPTNAWSPWYKVWTAGNDGQGSGLDADKLQAKDSKWYTNALNIDGGSLNDSRLQPIMSTKKFLESLTTVRYIDKPHYEIYFSGRLNNGDLNFSVGATYSLYNDILQVVGQVTLKQIEQKFPIENVRTELNYVILTVQLDSGSIGAASKIGYTGFEQTWSSLRISPFGTYTSSTLQDDGTGARLILGRNDGNNVANNTPANGAIIDFHSSGAFNDYDVRIQVTGGNITNGNGALNITGNGFTYNNNTVWHSGNDSDTSGLNANFLQGITKSQVMRTDENTSTSGSLTVAGVATLNSLVVINDAAQLADNTTIDPDSYTNKVVAGTIADGGGFSALGIGGNAGAGKTWAIGHNGTSLYFAIGNGSAANTLATWAQVDADRTIRLFAKDNSSIFFSSGNNDYRIWNENNDGAGSGLDADLLDGRDWNSRDYSILRTSGDYIAGGIYKSAGVTKYQTSNFGFLVQHSDGSGVSAGGGGRLDFVFGTNSTRGTDVNVTNSLTFSFDKSGQLIIPATTGTAPLSVSSTTKVANLNADLLDDQTGAYYTNMNNADAGTLAAVRGGTGLNSYAVGDILYATATTPTLGKLAIGTANQILTVTSDATAPQWTTPSAITVGAASKVAVTFDSATNSEFAVGYFEPLVTPATVKYSNDATNGLKFNPSTGKLTAKEFSGTFTGNATSSTNVSGGAAGSLVYQSGVSTTSLLPIGTAGQVLVVNPGATAPTWTSQINITAGNIVGGAQGELLYQSASATTAKLPVGTAGFILSTNGANNNPSWIAQNTITAGNIAGGSAGQILYQSGADATAKLSIGTAGQVLVVNSTADAPLWVASTTLVAGNISSISSDTGSLLYQSAVNTTSKLSQGTASQVLISGGAGAAPSWTNQSSITAGNITAGAVGDLLYQSGSGATSKLTIGTAGQVLVVNPGATAPSWTAQSNIAAGNLTLSANNAAGSIPYNTAASTTTGLAIGTAGQVLVVNGTANAPQWTAQSNITAGNITAGAAGDLLYQSGSGATSKLTIGTAGQVLVVNAGATAPSWTAQSGLTVGNISGGVAGNILYQSAAGTTAKLASTTNNGWVISYNTTSSAPQWTDPGTLTVSAAANITGGAAGQVLYQSAAGTTAKLAAGATTQVLIGGATAPAWSNISGLAVASAVNLRLAASNAAGSIPYNTAADTTTGLAIGSANAILTVNAGGTAPQWTTNTSVTVGSAGNITAGAQGEILYQSSAGTTAKLAVGTSGSVLTTNGSAANPTWTTQANLNVGSAVSVRPATNNTTGALLVQSAANTTAGIAAVATGSVLTSAGLSTVPTWSATSGLTVGKATNLVGGAAGTQRIAFQSAVDTTSFLTLGSAQQVLRVNSAATGFAWTGGSSAVTGGTVIGNVVVFTTTNTGFDIKTVFPWARMFLIEIWGAGGGGGSGFAAKRSTATGGGGGGSGAPGAYNAWLLLADSFTGTFNVSIGVGGTGGLSAVRNAAAAGSTNGNNGGGGGNSSVSWTTNGAGAYSAISSGGGGGFGGTTAGGSAGAAPSGNDRSGGYFIRGETSSGGAQNFTGAVGTAGNGGAGSNPTTSSRGKLPTAGGAGGGYSAQATPTTTGNGGNSGSVSAVFTATGGTGVANNAANSTGNSGGPGSSALANGFAGVGGGGGGAARSGTSTNVNFTVTGGNGGAGGVGGGGGGGGGAAVLASTNTANAQAITSGAGGAGGSGLVIITAY